MLYQVSKPLRYFKIGAQMDIDPEHPLHPRLIVTGKQKALTVEG